jgi:cyclophilin family peptidyl-prolyl cis-trans isomerase
MQKIVYYLVACISIAGSCFSLNQETTMQKKETNPVVLVKTTAGDLTIELYPEKAPATVKNFLDYVTEGFYDHTIFHRVIPGFMIQGGGFTKEMKQKQPHAPIKNEAENGLTNDRGTLAMARTNDINSATAQFFINTVNNGFLNYQDKAHYGYCVFGKVTSGLDVVDKITKSPTGSNGPHQNVPVQPIEIISARLVPAN